MAFYILLFKPHVSGLLKSPAQTWRMAAKVPRGAITGEASRGEGCCVARVLYHNPGTLLGSGSGVLSSSHIRLSHVQDRFSV